MKTNLIILFVLISVPLMSQHKVGVRAGLNYNTFSGPLEEFENYGVNGGFHFGINYTYLLDEKASVRAELLYVQRGAQQSLIDTLSGTQGVYYIVNPTTGNNFVTQGKMNYNLDITNSYLSIPLTFNYQVSRRIELFVGASADFLIGPSARGLIDFESPGEFFFEQSLDYSYNNDEAGGSSLFNMQTVSIDVGDDNFTMPRFVGAYYQWTSDQKVGKRFKSIDAHLIIGANYFINSGFYVGARLEYGINDITNDEMDISLRDLNQDQTFVLRNDKDHSVSLGLSLGFRF